MNKKDVSDIASKIDHEESIFAKKSFLDPLLFPSKIIGRTYQKSGGRVSKRQNWNMSQVPRVAIVGSLAKSSFIKTLQETNDIIWKSYVGL